MKFQTHIIDVTGNIESRQAPVFVLTRDATDHAKQDHKDKSRIFRPTSHDEYWVPKSSITPGGDVDWAIVRSGEQVLIPLFAYKLEADKTCLMPAQGIMLSSIATESLIRKTHLFPAEVIIIASDRLYDLRPQAEAFRFALGLAFRMPNPHTDEV